MCFNLWEKRKLAVLLICAQTFSATLHLSVAAHCNWCKAKPKGTLTTHFLSLTCLHGWLLSSPPSLSLPFPFGSLQIKNTKTNAQVKDKNIKDNIPSVNRNKKKKGDNKYDVFPFFYFSCLVCKQVLSTNPDLDWQRKIQRNYKLSVTERDGSCFLYQKRRGRGW